MYYNILSDYYWFEINNVVYDHNKHDNDGIDDGGNDNDDCMGEYISD